MSKCKNPNCKCEDCQCGDDCRCGEDRQCHCSDKCHSGNIPNHNDSLPRLNRISGQLDGIKKMIGENRYCMDIIIQIRAARAALKSVEKNILKKHLQHCVATAFSSNDHREEKIDELIALFEQADD